MIKRLSGFLVAALGSGLFSLGLPGPVQTQSAAFADTRAVMPESAVPTDGQAVLDDIKKAFEGRFPGIDVTAAKATRYPGLYEIQLGTDVVYTNAGADYVLQGSLIDTATRVDLTAARIAQLTQVAFDSLPLDLAVKQVKGDGSRQLAVFEDPNCGYCKQLHKSLAQMDNITVYTLLFPILSPDSKIKARDIWCAKDQAAAWRGWMLNGTTPATAKCDAPLDTILALGRKLRVQGTPAIIFADGSRVNGALPLPALKQKLDTLK